MLDARAGPLNNCCRSAPSMSGFQAFAFLPWSKHMEAVKIVGSDMLLQVITKEL